MAPRGDNMKENNLDFDNVVDRYNTWSLKYDFAKKYGKSDNIMPLWVADMDFKTSSYVLETMENVCRHGIFGYSEADDSYFNAVAGWMKEKHGWNVEREWIVKTPGVVFALAMAVRAYTKEGDAVIINQPVYYPFSEVITNNGRVIVNSSLVLGENGKYHIDFCDFERKIIENNVKMYILCSPHNPVGRVWSREELVTLGNICVKHNVIVCSDEIHEDFVYTGFRHNVFADICEEFRNISITCTSPAKTFNLAGLQVSNIFISNPSLRDLFVKQVAAAGYSQINIMGLAACKAAYAKGTEWYRGMLSYIEENVSVVREFLENEIKDIRLIEPEGTYLLWLDFRNILPDEHKRRKLIEKNAGLWLDAGIMFGEEGKGFERINAACPRTVLVTALEKLKKAVNNC